MKEQGRFSIETHNFLGDEPLAAITIDDRRHQDFAGGEVTLAFSSGLFRVIMECAEKHPDCKIVLIVPQNYIPSICILSHLWLGAWEDGGNNPPVIIVTSNKFNIKSPNSRDLIRRVLIPLENEPDKRAIEERCRKSEGVIALKINSGFGDINLKRAHQTDIMAELLESMKKKKT
ncbi:MAG: hypothetical protein WC323_03715 [Patescibacteria group bacterium]|jgi:hypothetical protein